MKVLYATQATGNGHISRANEILPYLEKICEVDVLLSGSQSDIDLNHFVKYRRKGLSFVFGKNGGIDFLKTFQSLQTKKFLREVRSIPVDEYDLVINDFEPLSAWACKNRNIPCISMSHQHAVVGKSAPKPFRFDPVAWMVLKNFAPCHRGVGFHFENYDENTLTPVIRAEIRQAYIRNYGHYTVYLPAYSDKKLIRYFSQFSHVQWHIFSKHAKKSYSESNCWIRPVTNYDFISSFTSCEGIMCGAGFETPAEALYMGKKLFVIPMQGQYEQQCNAVSLVKLGVPVMKKLKKNKVRKVMLWLKQGQAIKINYPDVVPEALERIFSTHKIPSMQIIDQATSQALISA